MLPNDRNVDDRKKVEKSVAIRTADPGIFTIGSLTTTSFTLSFQAVPDAFIYQIYDGVSPTPIQGTQTVIPLSGYQPGTLVQLIVFAVTLSGNILVGSQDVLLKPDRTNFPALATTNNSLTASNFGNANGADLIAIEYRRGGTLGTLEGTAYILPSASEKKIEVLQPSTLYGIRVYTEAYAGGLTERSDPRVTSARTKAVNLGEPVVGQVTTNTIMITWSEQVPYIHRIFIQEKGSNAILDESNYTQADSATSHTFDVQPATLYQVTMQLISSSTGNIFLTFSRDVRSLPEAPLYVQITSVDKTSITLTWDIPDNATSDGFEISLIPPPSPGNYPIIVDERSYTIQSLQPGTVYDISVVSLSGQADNCQTVSSPVQITTTTEPLGVFEAVAIDIRDTSASVVFTPYDVMFFDVLEYEVTITPSAGGTAEVISVQQGIYNADIIDLTGGTAYDVEVAALDATNQRFSITATTSFVTLPKSPVSLTPVSTGFFSFTVELEPPVNSSFDGFVITANGVSQQIFRGETYQVTFEGLTPGVIYNVDAYTFLFTPDLTSQSLLNFNPITIITGAVKLKLRPFCLVNTVIR